MSEIIRLAYLGGENFTLTDTENLTSKEFFNGSLGPIFDVVSLKLNYVSPYAIFDIWAPRSFIDTAVMHQ
jgi:hypothetical protein